MLKNVIIHCCHMYVPVSCRQSYSQNRRGIIPITSLYGPMGRREIFHTFLLLVEIEGHFTHELVSYVYETQDW
jgi:hypothetical protein